jgi:hypothetical protein
MKQAVNVSFGKNHLQVEYKEAALYELMSHS